MSKHKMNFEEAMAYLTAGSRGASRLGLERMEIVLSRFGNPERKVKAVHIAGTNGKGSTTAFAASIFAAAGLRTGMFCSPFVDRFGERIRILDGKEAVQRWWSDPSTGEIPPASTSSILNRMRDVIDELGLGEETHPTHFEMLTIIAFIYFAENDCDIIVLETGLGGRLDSTNIIPAPEAAVITSIGYDHIHVLGDTLGEIAGEKAGIIKPGTRCYVQDQVTGDHSEEEIAEIMDAITSRCNALDVPLTVLAGQDVIHLEAGTGGQRFLLADDPTPFETGLIPKYQSMNAALAVLAARDILADTFRLSKEQVHEAVHLGVRAAYVPARFELLSSDPYVVRDGGHNPQGAFALSQTLDTVFPESPIYMILAVMNDKDYGKMIDELIASGRHDIRTIYCVAPDTPRALAPEKLAAALQNKLTEAHNQGMIKQMPQLISDLKIEAALTDAAERISASAGEGAGVFAPGLILAWGSLYQAGETLSAWQAIQAGLGSSPARAGL